MTKGTEVATTTPAAVQTTNEIVMQMATNPDVDVEKLERLLDLRDRELAKEARRAFNAALAAFHAEVPPIPQTRGVRFDDRAGSKAAYYYADLNDIEKVVRPLLLAHGLSYTFDTALDDRTLTAYCKLTHEDGHTEVSQFSALVEKQAKMNSIQASGSTRSYCKRYALIDALGISTCDVDDDAVSASEPVEVISDSQLADLVSLMQEVFGDDFIARKQKFIAWLGCELSEIPASRYQEAVNALEVKRQ